MKCETCGNAKVWIGGMRDGHLACEHCDGMAVLEMANGSSISYDPACSDDDLYVGIAQRVLPPRHPGDCLTCGGAASDLSHDYNPVLRPSSWELWDKCQETMEANYPIKIEGKWKC